MRYLPKCLWLFRPRKFLQLLIAYVFLQTIYLTFDKNVMYTNQPKNLQDSPNITFNRISFNATNGGYLVWNSKCQIMSVNPYDPSIIKFVKREKFVACSTEPKLTSISRQPNSNGIAGKVYLLINRDVAKHYRDLACCWAVITRPTTLAGNDTTFDSRIKVGSCRRFQDRVLLGINVQVIYVGCRWGGNVQYENIHAVINPARARKINNTNMNRHNGVQALSVLMLGFDSVSRLNFHRTMPATRAYFEQQGWVELRGYNKMGDNTFPNLMAVLSGQNESWAFDKCKPKDLYGMDNCSMIWHDFRDAGYATAYAEDFAAIGTFNLFKVGFVEPPTDYYLRPYILATEYLLDTRSRFGPYYCTGPELSVDRILDCAVDFSKAFLNSPYFGFFWTNTISHDYVNGPSAYDARFLAKLQDMENEGVMNHSMVVVLADHGMRTGDFRNTSVGWYEERLPFIYIWLPQWFRKQNPESYAALRINQNRLTSPYDLYETLRDILQRAGGQAAASTGCPRCSTLFQPVAHERGCKEAGIAAHWCTCQAFEPANSSDPIVIEGAVKFVDHMENIVKQYKNDKGDRLCVQPRVKRIIIVKKVLNFEQDPEDKVLRLFYLLEVTPGNGLFETTISYDGLGNYTIRDQEVSRINSYGQSSRCLGGGFKQYCHCDDYLFVRAISSSIHERKNSVGLLFLPLYRVLTSLRIAVFSHN